MFEGIMSSFKNQDNDRINWDDQSTRTAFL